VRIRSKGRVMSSLEFAYCRDISMVVLRLYSGNVIVNDYVVPAVKCRDIPMVVRRLYIL
jgi:hypothetical protein